MSQAQLPLGLDLTAFRQNLNQARNQLRTTLDDRTGNQFARGLRSVNQSIQRNIIAPLGQVRRAITSLPGIGGVVAGAASAAAISQTVRQAVGDVRGLEDQYASLGRIAGKLGQTDVFRSYLRDAGRLSRELAINEGELAKVAGRALDGSRSYEEMEDRLRAIVGLSRRTGGSLEQAQMLMLRAESSPNEQLIRRLNLDLARVTGDAGRIQGELVAKEIRAVYGPLATELINPADEMNQTLNEMKLILGEEIRPILNDAQRSVTAILREWADTGLRDDMTMIANSTRQILTFGSGVLGVIGLGGNALRHISDVVLLINDQGREILGVAKDVSIWIGNSILSPLASGLSSLVSSISLIESVSLGVIKGIGESIVRWILGPINRTLDTIELIPGVNTAPRARQQLERRAINSLRFIDDFRQYNQDSRSSLASLLDGISEDAKGERQERARRILFTARGEAGIVSRPWAQFEQRSEETMRGMLESWERTIRGWDTLDQGVQEAIIGVGGGLVAGRVARAAVRGAVQPGALEASRASTRELVARTAGQIGGLTAYGAATDDFAGIRGMRDRLSTGAIGPTREAAERMEAGRAVQEAQEEQTRMNYEQARMMADYQQRMATEWAAIREAQFRQATATHELRDAYTSHLDDGMQVGVTIRNSGPQRFRRARPRR